VERETNAPVDSPQHPVSLRMGKDGCRISVVKVRCLPHPPTPGRQGLPTTLVEGSPTSDVIALVIPLVRGACVP
jgi:hypothetical protein